MMALLSLITIPHRNNSYFLFSDVITCSASFCLFLLPSCSLFIPTMEHCTSWNETLYCHGFSSKASVTAQQLAPKLMQGWLTKMMRDSPAPELCPPCPGKLLRASWAVVPWLRPLCWWSPASRKRYICFSVCLFFHIHGLILDFPSCVSMRGPGVTWHFPIHVLCLCFFLGCC